jgi:rieske iron-sulfur protein
MSDRESTGGPKIDRRTLMRWFVGIGAFSSLAALASVLGTVRPPQPEGGEEIAAGDRLIFAVGGNKGEVIRRTSILPGQAVLAYPEGKEVQDNLIMVLHFNEKDLQPPTRLDWAPEGFVAYSAICTHLGCTVNFSHDPMQGAPYPHIHCPCHAGLFNPLAGAKVVGGPPPRPLPQLPLAIDDQGELVAAGPFEEPVGVLGG